MDYTEIVTHRRLLRVLLSAIEEPIAIADVNGDGVVNILDLVQIANHI